MAKAHTFPRKSSRNLLDFTWPRCDFVAGLFYVLKRDLPAMLRMSWFEVTRIVNSKAQNIVLGKAEGVRGHYHRHVYGSDA